MNQISIILLVGGKGKRINDLNTKNKFFPKSFQKINSKILISHAMKSFTDYNFNNFILPIGNYKEIFYEYFTNIKKINGRKCNIFLNSDEYKKAIVKKNKSINIFLTYTGINSNKASRILKVIKILNLENFGVSYGDGVGNINLKKLFRLHTKSKAIMSVAANQPKSQYGHFIYDKNQVIDFLEKPKLISWTNIGYFFLKKKSIEYIEKNKKLDFEMGAMKKIANDKKLLVYKHNDFWKSVDTLKDAQDLGELLKKKISK